MRAFVLCFALLACLMPALGQSGSTACQNAANLPPKLATNLTATINAALLPKADNTYTNSSSNAYISFKTPSICWSGNWFGYHVIPSGCLQNVGGKTYQGSTGRTVTVAGIYGLQVDIAADQTSCSTTNGVTTTTNAMTITAEWPTITTTMTLDWYPIAGGETGIGITLTIKGMKMVMQGAYGYQATPSTKQGCITSASVSSTAITYTDISGVFTIAGGNAGNVPSKVLNRIGAAITNKGPKVTSSVNAALASNVVGTCKTVSTTG